MATSKPNPFVKAAPVKKAGGHPVANKHVPGPPAAPHKGAPVWTMAKDDAADRRAGIREDSKRDKALDKKRGVK